VHIALYMDALMDLVQEEDHDKKWSDNVKEDCAAMNLNLVEATRQTLLEGIRTTLGLPARENFDNVSEALSISCVKASQL